MCWNRPSSNLSALRSPRESHVWKAGDEGCLLLPPGHAQPVPPGRLSRGAGNMAVCLRLPRQAGITNALAVSLSLSPASPPPSRASSVIIFPALPLAALSRALRDWPSGPHRMGCWDWALRGFPHTHRGHPLFCLAIEALCPPEASVKMQICSACRGDG